jgi:hypothetical protein
MTLMRYGYKKRRVVYTRPIWKGSKFGYYRRGRARPINSYRKKNKIVKRIAKKTVLNLAETKYLIKNNALTHLANPNHSGDKTLTVMVCLADADEIIIGNTPNTRIGNSIFIQGFKLNMKITNPTGNLTAGPQSDILDVLNWTRVYWYVCKYNGPIQVKGAGHFPDNILVNQKDLNLASQNQNIIIIKRGIVKFGTSYEKDGPTLGKENIKIAREVIINKYVKINKKQHFTGQNKSDYRSAYFFVAYAHGSNQGISSNANGTGYWCNTIADSATERGDLHYHPSIYFNWTTYFKDV